jgi:hypothetical protein
MGIQINGQTDTISAIDGSLTVSGADLPTVTNLNATGISTFSKGIVIGTGTSISSPTTNTLTLGTNNAERVRVSAGGVSIGTVTTYGDSNASFTSLSLGGNGTRYGLLEIKQSNSVAGSWIDCYGTNGNGDLRITTAGTSNKITFWTGGAFTEKVCITSDGNLGIGSAIPSNAKLDLVSDTSTPAASFYRQRNTSGGGLVAIYDDVGATRTREFLFASGGDLTLDKGNLVFSTSGKGIDFSATANSSGTMTSELLNDYEEGTWTPIASANSGTITSYTSSGRYTKIGRQVVVKFIISISNQGTASGQYLIFSGLPFLASNTWTNIGVCREQNVNGFLSTAQINANATNGSILRYDNSGVIVNGSFQCTICYDVD